MAKIYTINPADLLEDVNLKDEIKYDDKELIESFAVNTVFNTQKHQVGLYVYDSQGNLLSSLEDYRQYKSGFPKPGSSNETSKLKLDPENDAILLGFPHGDVYCVYNFLFNPFTKENKEGGQFYISEISEDSTELRLEVFKNSIEDLRLKVEDFQKRLNESSNFDDFKINCGDNRLLTALNIKYENVNGKDYVDVKLYEPAPSYIELKKVITLVEEVSNPVGFSIEAELEEEEIFVPKLKGPNFNVEVADENNNPTEYLSVNELFAYPISSSYYEIYSLFNENSAAIAIDHTQYDQFIHFSSVEERLRNFKYKLDLITSYDSSINTINTANYILTGISGSREHYENLIKGVVNNFDHYERYLYFESGSKSWPKSNDTRPYTLETSATQSWYNEQIASASIYDTNNFDILTNTIPEFIRDDSRNSEALAFVYMLGQHFDNIWIYLRAVSDKFDADNRINYGISKDLVRDALQSMGVKLYNSNFNLGEIFAMFTGAPYASGSEQINTYSQITTGSANQHLQPMPMDTYQKEVYKRIYHNLPMLSKGKGTERALRALINCFGIPSEMLSIKMFGGGNVDGDPFLSSTQEYTSSLDKIRLDNTGSLSAHELYVPKANTPNTSSVLSNQTFVLREPDKFAQDIHTIEIGVSFADNINNYIKSNLPSGFDYDEYVGDPREEFEKTYSTLETLSEDILGNIDRYDTRDFIRLIKFFDNSIFRIVRDFIPARSNLNAGIIIKPHLLDKSKAKQVSGSAELPKYTGSVSVQESTGSDGSTFGGQNNYKVNWIEQVTTISGSAPWDYHESRRPAYDGEFSGSVLDISTGELNNENIVKTIGQPDIFFQVVAISDAQPLVNFCNALFTATVNYSAPSPTPTVPTPTATPAPIAYSPVPSTKAAPTSSTPASGSPTPVAQAPTVLTPTPTVPTPTPVYTSPSPGGGGGCIVYGTKILMATGQLKNVEDVVAGDLVRAYNIEGLNTDDNWYGWGTLLFNGEPTVAEVRSNELSTYTRYYLFNDTLKITNEHPMLIKRDGKVSWEASRDVNVGDQIFNSSYEWISVESIKEINEDIQVASPDVEEVDNYFAEGILLHNNEQDVLSKEDAQNAE